MKENAPLRVHFDQNSARPRPGGNFIDKIVHYICAGWLKFWGWEVKGDWPIRDHGGYKSVLVAAPHTSNWDGLHMLAATGYFQVKLRWIGKKSLTTGPFGGLVKWLGCVPVDRSASHDVVSQMREAFNSQDDFILLIPPEGTRGQGDGWKSGFYHIAHGADVPIVLSILDYGNKTVRLSGCLHPSGNYEDDFDWIKTHYENAQGKYNDKFSVKMKAPKN